MVQFHLYGNEYYDPWDLATEMTRRTTEVWSFDKPVFCGEFGYGGEDPVTHDHTHVGIWSALMSGGGALSHTAPVFQIDSDEPMTPARGAHFRVLSNFMRSLDRWPDPRPRHDVTATPSGTRVWALRSEDDHWALSPASSTEPRSLQRRSTGKRGSGEREGFQSLPRHTPSPSQLST